MKAENRQDYTGSREMLIARDCRRLQAAGVKVEPGVRIELDPRKVFDDADAAQLAAELGLETLPADTVRVIG